MTLIDLKTKQCIFCAETIQSEAIKCRFCGEFLNTAKARALEAAAESDEECKEGEGGDDKILFAGRPSLWGVAGDAAIGLFFTAIGALLIMLPLERMLGLELTVSQAAMFAQYRVLGGLGIISVVVSILAMKILRLKMIYYEVTPDRIEWSRGILDRRVDNLDMLRVIDLKLRRSLLDCILGVGTVALVTTDKTDPKFKFEKVRDCRLLYDVIKKASLEADRRTGVVHLE
jgi:membrane protein YdbS with pleckstrin-like domain